MPFDSGLSPGGPSPVGRSEHRGRPRLKLGVFSHRGAWKVYEEFGAPALYPTRQEAVAAAELRAFAEVRSGHAVEFFIEDEDGALRQIDLH